MGWIGYNLQHKVNLKSEQSRMNQDNENKKGQQWIWIKLISLHRTEKKKLRKSMRLVSDDKFTSMSRTS